MAVLTLDVPHPQLETTDAAWYIAVSDGACFEAGVDFLVGPFDSDQEAWEAHNRLRPWPCRVDHATPTGSYCDCMVVPALREKAPR